MERSEIRDGVAVMRRGPGLRDGEDAVASSGLRATDVIDGRAVRWKSVQLLEIIG